MTCNIFLVLSGFNGVITRLNEQASEITELREAILETNKNFHQIMTQGQTKVNEVVPTPNLPTLEQNFSSFNQPSTLLSPQQIIKKFLKSKSEKF